MNQMKSFLQFLAVCMLVVLLTGCTEQEEHRVVVCVPVYGQSLALGEEAELLTNLDSLVEKSEGRIVTQRLDHDFGYFDNSRLKEWGKRLVGYRERSFELSVYAMAELLCRNLGPDTLICVFPGGKGTTPYSSICKGTEPYQRLLDDIQMACKAAKKRGWDFLVPAVCWMHGESDMADHTGIDYKQALWQFSRDVDEDVRRLIGQDSPVRTVCYQTNQLTRAHGVDLSAFSCPETTVPQGQMELVRDDTLFWASSPVYPFTFAHEGIHLDGTGQRQIGLRAGASVLAMLRHQPRHSGLVPRGVSIEDSTVVISFRVPCPPLQIDTVQVATARCYGFSVVTAEGEEIARHACVGDSTVRILCTEIPENCKVRYAVNGTIPKTGPKAGPRGNLHDSQLVPNWCYQFDWLLKR